MLESFLRSVTKDFYGPIVYSTASYGGVPVTVQRFHDAYSMFQWGKMPDALVDRAKANTFVFTYLNQLLASSTAWKEFLRSPDSLAFRKAGSSIPQTSTTGHVSSMLNEIAETFPARTHFIGVVSEETFKKLNPKEMIAEKHLYSGEFNFQHNLFPVCEYFPEEKIPASTVMGRAVWDYSIWKKQLAPKVLPFEVHCHFSLTEESLFKLHTESLALPKTASLATLQVGSEWDFPLMELVLSQHPYQKKIGASEALWITDWKPEKLQELYLRAAWIGAFIKHQLQKSTFKLTSIPLRFGIDGSGAFVLVDSGALEDFFPETELQGFYKKTSWSEGVIKAQRQGEQAGFSDWKRFAVEPAPWLDPKVKESAEHRFRETAKTILGKTCS